MRLAVLGDIHGNPIALDAVLADIDAWGGVDGYLFTGDYSAIGYDPVTPLERVSALPNASFVRGNTDRETYALLLGDDELSGDPARVRQTFAAARGFSWTLGYLSAAGGGWLAWLRALPVEQRLTLPDGTRVLLVHASPGTDTGEGVRPTTPADQLRESFAGCGADLVLVGHIHWPQDHRLDAVRIVNVGSVSNPPATDWRASYVRLEAGADGHSLGFRRVAYDRGAAIEAARRSEHPARNYILDFLESRYEPPWLASLGLDPVPSPLVHDHRVSPE